MCQDVMQQGTGSSLGGNMLIFQASVSGSGQRFSASYGTRPVSAHPLGAISVS